MNKPDTPHAAPYVVSSGMEDERTWSFYECEDVSLLKDPELDKKLSTLLNDCGIQTFGGITYKFSPPGEGSTAVMVKAMYMAGVIVGASRADAHCWPEVGTMIVGCFSCGEKGPLVDEYVRSLMERTRPRFAYEIPDRKIFPVRPRRIPRSWISLPVPSQGRVLAQANMR